MISYFAEDQTRARSRPVSSGVTPHTEGSLDVAGGTPLICDHHRGLPKLPNNLPLNATYQY